jgi:hypothetical protein
MRSLRRGTWAVVEDKNPTGREMAILVGRIWNLSLHSFYFWLDLQSAMRYQL